MQGRLPRLSWALLLVAILAAPARAEVRSAVLEGGRTARIYPGERMVVRVGPAGDLTLVSAAPAAPDAASPPRPGAASTAETIDTAEPGTVTVALTSAAETKLRLDSGLAQAFDYVATLQVRKDGRTVDEPVAVCTALPLLASFEAWPRSVSSVTVAGFKTRPTNEVLCPEPQGIGR
jgi:hypothetical protein